MSGSIDIRLTVNGETVAESVEPRVTLVDFVRETLGLTGSHVGCEHGVCGACTVLVDGDSARACLMFAVQADRRSVETVESLGRIGAMNKLQEAFHEHHALQCGFCTPGFLTTITAGLRDNPDPTHEEARDMIAGNLCRCTGYQNIVKAVERAAELARGFETGASAPSSTTGTPESGQLAYEDRDDDNASTGLGA